MQDQLVDFATALVAKRKGFDEPCLFAYTPLKDWMVGKSEHDRLGNGMYLRMNGNPFGMSLPSSWALHNSKLKDATTAPAQSLLQQWLRDKHTDVTIPTDWGREGRSYISALSYANVDNEVDIWISKAKGLSVQYKTYGEALEVALLQGLKLLPDAS